MDFELSDEQLALRDVSRSMLAANCPNELIRALAVSGTDLDEKLWRRGADLGWLGLAVPEDRGGFGQGLVELCLVAEEIGRAAAPGPFLDSALVAVAGVDAGLPDGVLEQLVEGETRAALAHHGEVTVRRDGDSLILTGRAVATQAAATVDWFLVTAHANGADLLVLVEAGAAASTRRLTLDETRRWYDVALNDVRVPLANVVTEDPAQVRWLADGATVLTAADALGIGERLLAMTTEYVMVREQFDRPLGSFQSVKHKVTDMLTTLKGARAAVYYAAMALDARLPDASLSVSVAKAFTSEGITALAGEALQTHGGIGFTWEHDLHLYLRRAKVDEVLFGGPSEHYERVVTLLE